MCKQEGAFGWLEVVKWLRSILGVMEKDPKTQEFKFLHGQIAKHTIYHPVFMAIWFC